MKLRDAVPDYLKFLRIEQGLSQNTVDTYRPRLRAFLEWLEASETPEPTTDNYTTPVLRRYVYHLSGNGNRPRTVRACFDTLRSFARFLMDAGALKENPTAAITLPKLDAAQRLEVNDLEVTALFEACERQRTMRLVALSRAVLSVLAYGGLRRDELCSLHVSDIDLADRSLLVRSGKGAKSRKVFICQAGANALRDWFAVREKNSQHEYVFSVDVSRRLHHKGLAALMETLKATAGLRSNAAIKPHGLRHWAATNLLRNGATLRDVQAHLGHANVSVTSRYLHADEQRLRTISELTALRPAKIPEATKATARPQREPERRGSRRIAR